ILTYVQTIFNCIIIGFVLYVFAQMILSIRTDLILKAKEHSRVLLQEIESCQKNYRINQCDPTTRVPALENSCNRWE
ncbi:Brl1/Brr6 domain-containing protein, partial [Phycomyces nitens]